MKYLALLAFLFATSQAWAAFGYYSPISINSAQVPSTQTDFPVLVSVTDARFKTVANGGHVQNSSGFDIRPYTNSGLGTAITGYELERYNASTGEVIMWVKVSSLTSSSTPFVLAYGDSGISTDGSSTATWSNNFISVYHLRDGTTLSVTDSVGAHNGTNNGATATTGKIDGGGSFVTASHQWIETNVNNTPTALTYSVWAQATTLPIAYNPALFKNDVDVSLFGILVKSNGKLAMYAFATNQRSYDGTGSNTLSTGTWYYLILTYDSSSGLVGYVNGASDGTDTANGNALANTRTPRIGGNRHDSVNFDYWNGLLDEARIASVARSADWITTEYNNQSAPGTFETLGTEVSLGATANGWFYFFP